MNEAYSRIIIDKKLREAGWDIENSSQCIFEDHGDAGRADYVLKDTSGHAIALIEAKRPDIDPYSAKKQAFDYIQAQYPKVRFIYLANDKLVYLWDLDGGGDAIVVPAFFSQEDLMRRQSSRAMNLAKKFSEDPVTENYFSDITDNVTLRPYQIDAWNAIAENYDNGKHAFLLEMATGTGKTVLASLIISRFLRSNNAQNVLFLVDRKSLAIQTKNTFERLLRGVSSVGTYWGSNRKNLTGSNVVVATIQSLTLHGARDFSPGYFDLIIHDEAHRSIYSPEARGVMDYFVGVTKIGLTATPKDFLKNIDVSKLGQTDPRAIELRLQRDTYKYFDCEKGQATFRYNIKDGVKDGFLVPAKLHKMTSILTQEALGDTGLAGEGDYESENYKISDLEKKVFIPKRNELMMKELLEFAEKTPAGEIGKTIVFAVNQTHALNLEKILNKLRPEYNVRFSQTITSYIREAHDLAKDFRNIDTKLPRIAVSVDMLTTGFDAPEVQNIVLARPVFEPTLYQQIKGRGTRLCKEINKQQFVIFDFCGVCEYFEEEYDWEAPLDLPRQIEAKHRIESSGQGPTTTIPGEEIIIDYGVQPTISRPDLVSVRDQIIYGPDGDKVDKEMYRDEWSKAVAQFANTHPEVKGMIDDENKQEELIELINSDLLNKPDFFFNEDNLSKSHQVIATIRDFFLSALGKKSLPEKEAQVQEWKNGLVDKYGTVKSGGSQLRHIMTKLVVDEVAQNEDLRKELKEKPGLNFLLKEPFSTGFTAEEWINTFGKEELQNLVVDISNSKVIYL